jgi:hypothetical protein
MAKDQKEAELLFEEWQRKGQFKYRGSLYKVGINDHSALQAMVPENLKMTGAVCRVPSQLTLTNQDMDSSIHDGFTIGRGKTFYWMMTWHKSGHATVYPKEGDKSGRWINGDTNVTVHFKLCDHDR